MAWRTISSTCSDSAPFCLRGATGSRDRRTFFAVFDPGVLAASPRKPGIWDNASERIFFGAFVSKFTAGADSLSWTTIAEIDSDYTGGDQQVLVRHYEVWNIVRPAVGPQSMTRFAVGSARLGLRLLLFKKRCVKPPGGMPGGTVGRRARHRRCP